MDVEPCKNGFLSVRSILGLSLKIIMVIIVGFRLEYLDAGVGGTYDGSYFYPGSTNTSLADIVIADCSFIYLPHISK
jgi:hypothetical protein